MKNFESRNGCYEKKTALILQILKDYIWSDEFKSLGRMKITHFVRERILTFPHIILYFINLAKKSLQISLNDFSKLADLPKVTKQAFSKARSKLSARAFILLNNKLIQEFYTGNQYATWKGLRLIAVDGSDIQLPQKEGIKKIFGASKNQKGPAIAMAKISYAYDVLNRLTLDAQVDKFKTSERDLAVRHVEAIGKLNSNAISELYIYDRGYPSLGLIFYLNSQKKDFLIRCSTSVCFSEIKEAFEKGKEDVIIRFHGKEAHPQQSAEIKKRLPFLDIKNAYVDLRVVVVTLKTGEKEVLITSLMDNKKYPKRDFKVLYNHRWGIEENYKWHKVALELENFSGHSTLAIEQDIFSLVFTANIASMLMEEAQNEMDQESKRDDLKHDYKINKRVAFAALKSELVEGLMNADFDMEDFCAQKKEEFKRYLCPLRPERQYARKEKRRLKYGCTVRRCI